MVMSTLNLITALRGFKVRPQTLDKFLAIHGDVNGTENGRNTPEYEYDGTGAASDKMSNILRTRVTGNSDSSGILVVVPVVYPHDRSPWVYVAYSHIFVYGQRLVPADIGKEVPQGFELLRQEILACSSSLDTLDEEGQKGFYIVITGGHDGPLPAELLERRKVPIHCGICEESFEHWTARQWHRNTVHQLDEDINAIPENA